MLHPSSITHAVLPQSVVVFLDIPSHCRRIVLWCTRTHNSSVHSFRCFTCIPPLHCVLFLPCCWCCCCCVVVVVSYWSAAPTCASSSLLLFYLLPILPRHDKSVLLANICSSACASALYHLVPFTLRRASHLKPPNIYYSPSPLLHCKIYAFPISHTPFLPLHMIVNAHSTPYTVAIRVPSDK